MRCLETIKTYLHERRGSTYVDFLVQFLIAIALVVSLVGFFEMFFTHQNVVAIAKRMVRVVEIEGRTDSLDALFSRLCDDFGLDNGSAAYYVENIRQPGDMDQPSDPAVIQLRGTFAIRVEYTTEWQIINVAGTAVVNPRFTFNSTLSGMSEVYSREGGP